MPLDLKGNLYFDAKTGLPSLSGTRYQKWQIRLDRNQGEGIPRTNLVTAWSAMRTQVGWLPKNELLQRDVIDSNPHDAMFFRSVWSDSDFLIRAEFRGEDNEGNLSAWVPWFIGGELTAAWQLQAVLDNPDSFDAAEQTNWLNWVCARQLWQLWTLEGWKQWKEIEGRGVREILAE